MLSSKQGDPRTNKQIIRIGLFYKINMIDLTQEEPASPEVLDLSQLDNDTVSPVTQTEYICIPSSPEKGNLIIEDEERNEENRRENALLNELETRTKSLKRLLDMRKQLNQGLVRKKEPVPDVDMSQQRGSKASCSAVGEEESTAPLPKKKKKAPVGTAESRAMKHIQKQFESEKHVLKFIEAVMSPDVMMQPLGLGIGQAFQQTAEKAEHERISYRVDRHGEYPYPYITWNRKIPSKENAECFDTEQQPYVMVCVEGGMLVEWIENGQVEGMVDSLSEHFTDVSQFRLSILVYRLDPAIREKELKDHKDAMSRGRDPEFCAEDIRQSLMDLSICRPHVEIFDAHSVEEAASHVLSVTKAISIRHLDMGYAGKYIAGKARGRTASSALNQLLTKEPLRREEMIYPLKALMALSAVVPAAAHALVNKFTNFSGLYEFLEEPSRSREEKMHFLGNMISSNGRRVGPKAAKQIVEAFLSDDPSISLS